MKTRQWEVERSMRYLMSISLVVVMLLLVGCESTSGKAEGWWGAPLPSDAREVTLQEIPPSYTEYRYLQFSTSPRSATEFVNNICMGGVYQGYDPYNAVDTSSPQPNSILVHLWDSMYYSHSPNTPDTIYGTRCERSLGLTQVLVDATDPDFRIVTVESSARGKQFIDGWYTYPHPDWPIRGYAVLQVTEFPLEIFGIESTNDEYMVIYNTICLETQLWQQGFSLGWVDARLAPFVDANVEIAIDRNPLPPAQVSARGTLVPLSEDGAPILSYGLWNYCVSPELESGTHTLTVKATTSEGEEYEYSLDFRVE